jgi:N utilization substance protein B
MGVRRQARESALQALYMCDALDSWNMESVLFCFDHFEVAENLRPYAEDLCAGVIENLADIDSKITCASEHWSINRMGRIDRAILRIATYELINLKDIPPGVAINEAIEISKRYSAGESPMFINGVLDKIASSYSRNLEVEQELIAEAEDSEELPEPEDDKESNQTSAR